MSFYYRDDAVYAKITLKGRREETIEALVDTGADTSAISIEKCIKLGLPHRGFRLFRGLFGGGFLPTYRGRFKLQGREIQLNVVGLLEDDALIGRDILSHYKLILDWKAKKAKADDP